MYMYMMLLSSGNTRSVLYKFSVDLPKKHGRGGQSALRFARLRLEKVSSESQPPMSCK